MITKEEFAKHIIHKPSGESLMIRTKRYALYLSIIQDVELYDSTEGHRLIDILTNGSELDIILVQEILDARKNTFQE